MKIFVFFISCLNILGLRKYFMQIQKKYS